VTRLWAHIALRALQRQAALLLALPSLLVVVGAASGQGVSAGGWLHALSLTWPAAQAIALADLAAALRRDDTALACALLGYSPRWLASALAAPALLLALTGAALNAHPVAPQDARAAPPLPACEQLALPPAIYAQCEALRRAPLLGPPRATLRRLAWRDLTTAPGGLAERLRRVLEPCLGPPLGAAAVALASAHVPVLAPIPRARALIAALLTLAAAHGLWSLSLSLLTA
jgi:hypothetical protein